MNGKCESDRSATKNARFTATHWSLVLRAGQADSASADRALEQLCRAYWLPLYAYVRRRGYSPAESEDLTQGFFATFLNHGGIQRADRSRGRFRTFMLCCLESFLTNEWDKHRAIKRGGGAQFVSWEELQAEECYQQEPADGLTPEKVFDRQWATTLLQRAMSALRRECEEQHTLETFELLHDALTGEPRGWLYRDAAEQLNTTEAAVKMRLHRMRQRFGQLVRDEVAQTVNSPAVVEEELRYLFTVWD